LRVLALQHRPAMDGAAGVVLRASRRGDPAVSIRRYIASLPASALPGLLAPAALTPELLRALWTARAPQLYPRIFRAAAAAAHHASVAAADALLTEAEALLAADARDAAADPAVRMRTLTTSATLLLRGFECEAEPGDPGRAHVPRLVVACARVAARLGQGVDGPAVAARICAALVRRVADAALRQKQKTSLANSAVNAAHASHIGVTILALLDGVGAGSGAGGTSLLSPAAADELREAVCMFVQHAAGRDTQDVPAVLKAALVFCSGGGNGGGSYLCDPVSQSWARLVRQIVRNAPVDLFADILSVIEWQLTETPAAADAVLRCYDAADNSGKATSRDTAMLLSIMRCGCDRVRALAMHIIASFIIRPLDLVDAAQLAAPSSSTASPSTLALNSCLLGSLALPGIDLRCTAVVDLCDWLLRAKIGADRCTDDSLRVWGVNFFAALFIRYDAGRVPVLDSIFSALAEDACESQVRALLCDVLDRVVQHDTAAVVFRALTGRIEHWLGYLSTMAAPVAIRVVSVLAPLAVFVSSFSDFFTVTLRKLSSTRSSHARCIATAGLVSLLVIPELDRETADDVIALTCSLLDTGSLRVRAVLLAQLAPRLTLLESGFLRDIRFEPIHRAVAVRVAGLVRDYHHQRQHEQLDPGTESCPLQLDACFEIVVGEPALRDAVPELLQYVIALRLVNYNVDLLFQAVVAYICDISRSIRDVSRLHERRGLNPKWVYMKSCLLIYMCELIIGVETNACDSLNRASILKTYAAALVIRDGVVSKIRPAPPATPSLLVCPASVCLDHLFAGSDVSGPIDQLTAREASALVFASGRGETGNTSPIVGCDGFETKDRSATALLSLTCLTGVLQEVLSLLSSEKQASLVVACELSAALLNAMQTESAGRSGQMSEVARFRILPIAVQLFCSSHPWRSGSKDEMSGETEKGKDEHNLKIAEAALAQYRLAGMQTGDMSMVTSDENDSEAQHQSTKKGDADWRRPQLFDQAALVATDADACAALERMRGCSAMDRYRVTLRFYALEILRALPVAKLEVSSAVWDCLIMDESSEQCESLLLSSTSPPRHEQIAHAILKCFEREFAFSMSTSLSVCYAQYLTRSMQDASIGDGVKAGVSQCMIRILQEYSITHPRVVRPMLALLLDAMKWNEAVPFLRSLFSWLCEERVDDGDDEDEKAQQGGLSFDVDLADYPGSAADLEAPGSNHMRGGDSNDDDVDNVNVVDSSLCDGVHEASNQQRGSVIDAEIDVRLLSLAETRECRVASLLACVSYLEFGLPRFAGYLSASDATVVSDICTLLSSTVLPHALPPAVETRLHALLAKILITARDAAKALRRAATTNPSVKGVEREVDVDALGLTLTSVLSLESVADRHGRLRFLWEQVLVETSASISTRRRDGIKKVLASVLAAMTAATTQKKKGRKSDGAASNANDGNDGEDDDEDRNVDDEYGCADRIVRRKRRRVRSRNRAVDSLLADEYGDDDGADLEDFLAGMDEEL
jgi:hypothetical protein